MNDIWELPRRKKLLSDGLSRMFPGIPEGRGYIGAILGILG